MPSPRWQSGESGNPAGRLRGSRNRLSEAVTLIIRTVPSLRPTFTVQNPRAIRSPSTIVNRTVTPRRPRNVDLREREYLTPKEVARLRDAARKHSRSRHRAATAILIAYRHGLRASELGS